MKFSLLDIILIVLFVQLLSITPFLLFDKSRTKSSKILALFLIAKALCITSFLGHRLWDYTFYNFPLSIHLGSSFTLLWGPLIYFYTRSLADRNFKFGKLEVLHISPFLFHLLFLFFNYHIKSPEIKQDIVSNGGIPGIFFQLSTYYIHISILCYTLLSFHILKEYRNRIRNTYSSIEKIKLTWMSIVLIGFSIKWLADIWFFVDLSFFDSFNMTPIYISRLALFLFINALIYYGFKQAATPEVQLFSGKKAKGSLSEASRLSYADRLTVYMDTEKPWRDPDITLAGLSRLVDIPQRSLSEVLNHEVGMSFYDFINMYRVKESKIILEKESDNRTILEILFEVGFNNKTSFNSAFKRITGMTPSQYRKSDG